MKQLFLYSTAALLLLAACNQGSGGSAETDIIEEKPAISIQPDTAAPKEPTAEEKHRESLKNPVPFNLKMPQLVGTWLWPEGADNKPSGFTLRPDGSMSYINEPGRKGIRYEIVNDSLILHFRFDGYKQNSTSTWIIRGYNDSTLTIGAIEAVSYRRVLRRS